jgi:hypothetical protein
MARPRVFSPTAPKAVRQTQKEKRINEKMQAKCLHLFCSFGRRLWHY